jgi:Sortase domain
MRRSLSLFLAILLASSAITTADALTIRRTWTARFGTNTANGIATLHAYTDGTGLLRLRLKALKADTVYSIQIRGGTCSSLGVVRASLYEATSDATGWIDTIRNVPEGKMNDIWQSARTGTIVLRMGSGSIAKCAKLAFNVATRITMSSLNINLPVIRGPSGYPPCNVAMYMPPLSQPREPGVTMIYAHARTGMFLPLLNASKVDNGASLLGKYVKVYTSDNMVHTYQITEVRRHVTNVQPAAGAIAERLWMYTSEGPDYTYPKLVVVAKRTSSATATSSASHPTPRPVSC